MEGRHCFASDCDQAPYVKPIAEYSHDLGCSITGGHVYRGTRQPELVGIYVFGDYCSGLLFTLQVDEGTTVHWFSVDSAGNVERNYRPDGTGKNFGKGVAVLAP